MDDLSTYITTFAQNLPGLTTGFNLIVPLIGLIAVINGLVTQFNQGRKGQGVVPAALASILIGSLMFSLPTVVDIFSASMFGSAADPKMIDTYTSSTGAGTEKAIQALVAFINFIGWIAVVRGLMRWRDGPKYDQPGWFGHGLTYVLAGSLATNFYVFADVLGVSIGAMTVGTEYFKFN